MGSYILQFALNSTCIVLFATRYIIMENIEIFFHKMSSSYYISYIISTYLPFWFIFSSLLLDFYVLGMWDGKSKAFVFTH